MSRMFLAAASTLAALAVATPAQAQGTGESVNQLIIYGDDACPPSTADQITVCARKDESERYRIPEALRQSDDPANESWTNRVIAYETVGDTGIQSCSPTGAGGWTGCLGEFIDNAYAERDTDASVRFSQLIEEERARRLAAIDAEAEETQSRVEEAEREYFERQQAEAQAASNDETGTPEEELPSPE